MTGPGRGSAGPEYGRTSGMPDVADGAAPTAAEREVKYVRRQIELLLYRLQTLPDDARARLQGELVQSLLDHPLVVDSPRGPVSFVTLGRVGAGRASKLLTKQPDTIAWIEGFDADSVFWDVGANVGVYTLYAALRADTRVVAFEPGAVNYYQLAANCELNGFTDRVQCLLAGLGRGTMVAGLAVSQAASGASFGFGAKKAQAFAGRQAAMIVSMDEAVEALGLPCPNYIKIDVPEMTLDVLAGGARTLARSDVREVHVEASETSTGGRRVVDTLRQHGFDIKGRAEHGATDLTFVRTQR